MLPYAIHQFFYIAVNRRFICTLNSKPTWLVAKQGKRIVVETHSDHFINRLRRHPTDSLKDTVSILFVHPPHGDEGATIEPLKVDRFGVIENWPEGFLPEAADEAQAIFGAGLRKRGVL